MKNGIHPDYHPVVFQDAGTGTRFLTRSTVTSDRTTEWDRRGPGDGHRRSRGEVRAPLRATSALT